LVNLNTLTKGITIPLRRLLAVALLFSSSFVWFYLFYTYLGELISPGIPRDSFWLSAGTLLFLVSIAASALLGSAISGRVKRRKMLLAWLFAGVIVTVLVPLFHGDEFIIILGIVAGLTFGVGFPSCQAFLSDSTTPDERGRVAGLTVLITFILVAFLLLAISALSLNSIGILLLAILVRSTGFLSFGLDPIDTDIKEKEPKPWRTIFGYRDFYLYLIPYLLFMIAAGFVSLFWQGLDSSYDDAYRAGSILRLVGLSAFAMLAGLMADRMGRKKPIILGLVMLGASYAIVGLLTTPETYFINLLLSGCAWGILIVVYLVVPGDLAFSGTAERFYTLGWVLPLVLWSVVYAAGNFLRVTPIRDIFSFILTIIMIAAILPLFSAVETLSESKMREREFREYTEKVGKVIQESKEPK
jgi:MFS family permease